MYHYTDEQLESMKKVEASRASRIENLHARMTAEEKDAFNFNTTDQISKRCDKKDYKQR